MSSRRGLKPLRPVCPTPYKRPFTDVALAREAVRVESVAKGFRLYLYATCPCGMIHMTKVPTKGWPNEPEVLFSLPDAPEEARPRGVQR